MEDHYDDDGITRFERGGWKGRKGVRGSDKSKRIILPVTARLGYFPCFPFFFSFFFLNQETGNKNGVSGQQSPVTDY